MFVDLSGDQLSAYRSSQVDPADFDEFWSSTLAESRTHALAIDRSRVVSPVESLDIFDVSFAGFDGQRVRAWLRLPRGAVGPLPTIVEFVGYGGGRGWAEDNLFWASCGFAHLQMDTRGQGATWSVGATPDLASAGPRLPGMMTAGIENPGNYYYRRLITDAVRAVDVALELPEVDAARLTALGMSQGGGLALAVAGLHSAVTDLVAYEPFLCDFPRAITITDSNPYKEISNFLSVYRDMEEQVLATLSYFDGVNFSRRATAPAHFTTALMDPICPPSTVMGAYQVYGGPSDIIVRTHTSHEHKTDEDIHTAAVLRAGWSSRLGSN